MPDQISFNDSLGLLGAAGLGTATLSGPVTINYGNVSATVPTSVTGSLQLSNLGLLGGTQTYSNLTILQTGTTASNQPVYTITGSNGLTGLSVSFTGQLPTNMTANVTLLSTSASVASGSGTVTASIVCFAAGTAIRTARGPVAVEKLMLGDLAITASGDARPIGWLGHRTIDCRTHARPHEVRPIRIAANAFGDARPARDLMVSPGHAICVDVVGEVLVPAGLLVNGTTIVQVEVDEVVYWHVELDDHDVILAEDLPCESYFDMGNRTFFADAGIVAFDGSPDADTALRTHADFCRPFHAAGAVVDAIRAQLGRRVADLGWTLDRTLELHLEVDGQRVDPVVRGQTARFSVPAGARDVWLVCPTGRPCDTMGIGDARDLGVCVAALRIEDGLSTPRDVALGDPMLRVGFHEVEDGARRWTAGRAQLPSTLWEGFEEGFYLRLDLAGPPAPRWARATEGRPRLALVAA